MATVTEMRARLREAGEDVPERGRLNAEMRAKFDALTADTDTEWDLDGDGTDEQIDSLDLEPSVPLEPERPPRTARAVRQSKRARPVGERIFGKKDKPAPAKGKTRRISVEHLIGRVWEGVARFTQPLSLPMSRCLQVQSPVAGMILEDLVAGTVVDRALQPIARAEEKAEKVIALVGPPVLVLAMEQSFQLPEPQRMMRQAMIVPMLKESLRIWLQVAGPKVEQAAAREQEYQATFGKTIDELIGLFFAPPPGMTPEQAEQAQTEAMAGAAA